jgi:hypothetical protein
MQRKGRDFVKGSSNLDRQEKESGVKPEQVHDSRTRYHLSQREFGVKGG